MARIEGARFGGVDDRLGDVVTVVTSDGGHVTWCYAADPDGNLVELQAWS